VSTNALVHAGFGNARINKRVCGSALRLAVHCADDFFVHSATMNGRPSHRERIVVLGLTRIVAEQARAGSWRRRRHTGRGRRLNDPCVIEDVLSEYCYCAFRKLFEPYLNIFRPVIRCL
jgi:hypothetical protein